MTTNAAAAQRLIDELADHLTPLDEARRVGFLNLAAAVDAKPGNSQLWKEYRAAEEAMREIATDDGTDDERRLVAALSAAVGDAANAEPADARFAGSVCR